jgi:hypothetical protein
MTDFFILIPLISGTLEKENGAFSFQEALLRGHEEVGEALKTVGSDLPAIWLSRKLREEGKVGRPNPHILERFTLYKCWFPKAWGNLSVWSNITPLSPLPSLSLLTRLDEVLDPSWAWTPLTARVTICNAGARLPLSKCCKISLFCGVALFSEQAASES